MWIAVTAKWPPLNSTGWVKLYSLVVILEHWQQISSCKEEWFIQVLRGWEPWTGSEADDQHKQVVNSVGNSASQRKRGRERKTYGQSRRSRSKFEQWKQIQKFRQGNICSCLSTSSRSCWGDCVGHRSQSLKWKLSSGTSELIQSANPPPYWRPRRPLAWTLKESNRRFCCSDPL